MFKKTSVYFKRKEYIIKVKVQGKKYLHFLEIETNFGSVYKCGHFAADDNKCVFDIAEGNKVIAFAGVMEVMLNECRLLNLSVIQKPVLEDCEHAE